MNLFTGIPLNTLQTWLTEAQAAYHALQTGTLTVSVGAGDKKVSFNPAQISELQRYIANLNAAINAASGTAPVRGVYLAGGKG